MIFLKISKILILFLKKMFNKKLKFFFKPINFFKYFLLEIFFFLIQKKNLFLFFIFFKNFKNSFLIFFKLKKTFFLYQNYFFNLFSEKIFCFCYRKSKNIKKNFFFLYKFCNFKFFFFSLIFIKNNKILLFSRLPNKININKILWNIYLLEKRINGTFFFQINLNKYIMIFFLKKFLIFNINNRKFQTKLRFIGKTTTTKFFLRFNLRIFYKNFEKSLIIDNFFFQLRFGVDVYFNFILKKIIKINFLNKLFLRRFSGIFFFLFKKNLIKYRIIIKKKGFFYKNFSNNNFFLNKKINLLLSRVLLIKNNLFKNKEILKKTFEFIFNFWK